MENQETEVKNLLPKINTIIRNAQRTGKTVEKYLIDLKFDPSIAKVLDEKAQQYKEAFEDKEKPSEEIRPIGDLKKRVFAGGDHSVSNFNLYFFSVLWTVAWFAIVFIAIYAGKSSLGKAGDIIVMIYREKIAHGTFFTFLCTRILAVWFIGILGISVVCKINWILRYFKKAFFWRRAKNKE